MEINTYILHSIYTSSLIEILGEAINLEYRWTVLTVTTVGMLMSTIDSRILIVGLPTMAAALGANAVQAIWFTQAYTLGSTVVILTIGRLSDIFGRVKIYIIGFTIFTVSSLLTSLSMNPNEVILFRAIQGFGSGILMVNSAALITDATPINKLGLSLGINQIAAALGSILGLTVSGVIIYFSGLESAVLHQYSNRHLRHSVGEAKT